MSNYDAFNSNLDWTMAKDYYDILADHKKSFRAFRIEKDVDALLSNIRSEIIHVISYIKEDKNDEQISILKDKLNKAENLIFKKVCKGRIGDDANTNNKSKAIRLIDEAQTILNELEATTGMLQPRPVNLKQKLRKYGD